MTRLNYNTALTMKIEAIIFYILQVLFVFLEAYIAYLLLKYLNRKSLGMQTILDKVVKDAIIICVLFDQILRVFVMGLIVEFARPLDDDVAFFIMTLLHFFSVSRFWIVFSVIMVRYILVFYPTYLNIFDESVTRRIIRCLVCILSAIIVLADSGNKNTKYYLLKGDEYLDIKSVPIFITILSIIIAIVLIVTQYQIENFKKAVDSQSFDNLETIQERQEAELCINQMHLNPYRIEIITGLVLGLINGFFLLWLYLWHGNLYINSLRKTLLAQVSKLILLLMFIFKNEKIYSFAKHSIQSKLFCQSSNDFHIHNRDNSKIYAIYKPEYEANDNFNFDRIEEDEIYTQHNDNQFGRQHESNDYEFSSVIFVKEYRKPENDGTDSQNIDQASSTRSRNDDEEDNWNNNDPMPGCSHWSED